MITQEHLNDLHKICTDAKVMTESNLSYIYLPGLNVISKDKVHKLDALLCPMQHPTGYMTRLFLSVPLVGAGQSNNWSEHRILEKQWHTWSWQNIPASQSPFQILAAHLRALR